MKTQVLVPAQRWLNSLTLDHPYVGLAAALGCTAVLTLLRFVASFPLAQGEFGYAAWVADDFFYYAVVAQNIVDSGNSSFDGVSVTNGYHPLWMTICIGLAAIFGIKSAAFFVAIFLVQSALIFGGVIAFAALLRRAGENHFVSAGGQMIATTVYGVVLTLTCADGMEVALLAPLTPLLMLSVWKLCERPTLKQAFIACALLCAMILSRLDMAIVIGPLCLGVTIFLVRRFGWKVLAKLLPASIALAPLAAYLAWNIAFFGDAIPVSGQAKRLMRNDAPFGLSLTALASFFDVTSPNSWSSPTGVTVLTAVGVLLTSVIKNLRSNIFGAGYLLLATGIVLFYLQTVATSDWMLWAWYFFPMIFSGAIGAGLVTDFLLRSMPDNWTGTKFWLAPLLSVVLVGAGLKANAWQLRQPPSVSNILFTRTLPILEFARSHPGRYAVGDGGGALGFILPDGIVQLEGLVNDKTLIEEITRESALEPSLKRQSVDYYITSGKLAAIDKCVQLTEPKQGGTRVARMRQTVCEEPIFTSRTAWLESNIWDVRDGLH